ncbi:MAG: hypothetical protein INQ03_07485 [Candidatus Heimdallarchaeota archaeon]|nr:hypothetical protein [Candidatus Heimdallarchaeota archaeon]
MGSNSENCILKILRDYPDGLSTQEIIDKLDFYPELCKTCKSGAELISMANKLHHKQKIIRIAEKGGFRWKYP